MSGTYKAIGINLKSTPLGETDRLLSVLTEEYGLLRVVAPGARKHKSSLSGRSGLFVVNQLLMAKGRTLDKIIQAESIESYPGLSQELGKLTAGQYLAELVLYQALSDQPQPELFCLLREHLSQIEQSSGTAVLPCLIQAIFHLLAIGGLAPQVHRCCLTQDSLLPDFRDPHWRVGFSAAAGGVFKLEAASLATLSLEPSSAEPPENFPQLHPSDTDTTALPPLSRPRSPRPELVTQLTAIQLAGLQQMATPDLHPAGPIGTDLEPSSLNHQVWLSLERLLRQYAQYHLDRPIRSAALIDPCFASPNAPSLLQPS